MKSHSYLAHIHRLILKTKASNAMLLFLLITVANAHAQSDTIYIKSGEHLAVSKLKQTNYEYTFTYITNGVETVKTRLLKILVDSVTYARPTSHTSRKGKTYQSIQPDNSANAPDNNLSSAIIPKKIKKNKKLQPVITDSTALTGPKEKPWKATLAFGLNIGNVLEFNPPSGTDKKTFSLTTSIDAGLNYTKDGSKFQMTNELHWLLALQKEGLASHSPVQRVSDQVTTLHDLSIGMGKKNKWNFNLIAKTATSFFTIYDGDYFKDITGLGQVQGFLSPYEVNLAPGIKCQPNDYFRISISPYSVKLFGVKNQAIANTGMFTKDSNADGVYDKFEYTRLGAELNIWYDRNIKQWLQMQYRLGVSSDYLEKVGKNGLLTGLFITKVKIIKDLYLTHRASLNGDFAGKILKPYYNQTILLSFAKTF